MRASGLAEAHEHEPESQESGVRSRSDRTSPMWRFLLRISPEMADMTDEEVRAMVRESRGPGPFLSHEEVMGKFRARGSEPADDR